MESTANKRIQTIIAKRERYEQCSGETKALAKRIVGRLYGENGHHEYMKLTDLGHAAKHVTKTDVELMNDMLARNVGANMRDANHVNAFRDDASAEEDIVMALNIAKFEIAAWRNGEHKTSPRQRLELYVPDVATREDLDQNDIEILAGPAFARTSDDICRTESASVHLILDPMPGQKETFIIRTAYPDITPGVSRRVPSDVTEVVKATEYYQRANAFEKATLEYMAADKPKNRPIAAHSKDRKQFLIPVDDFRPGAALSVSENGTVKFLPPLDRNDEKPRVVDTKNPATRDKIRAQFPDAFDIAEGLQARIDELNNFDRPALSRRPVERKTLPRRDETTAFKNAPQRTATNSQREDRPSPGRGTRVASRGPQSAFNGSARGTPNTNMAIAMAKALERARARENAKQGGIENP